MEKKYYPIYGGEIPTLKNREYYTIEEIKSNENTFMGLVTLRRIKEKVIEYLNSNDISYEKIIISPSLDLLVSENDIKNYPVETENRTYNWGFHLDVIPEYVSLDLSCVVYIDGDDEEFIKPQILEELGINLKPIIIKYSLFVKALEKQEITSHELPPTFVEYKKRFIDEEVKQTLGYSIPTDIVISTKTKVK